MWVEIMVSHKCKKIRKIYAEHATDLCEQIYFTYIISKYINNQLLFACLTYQVNILKAGKTGPRVRQIILNFSH